MKRPREYLNSKSDPTPCNLPDCAGLRWGSPSGFRVGGASRQPGQNFIRGHGKCRGTRWEYFVVGNSQQRPKRAIVWAWTTQEVDCSGVFKQDAQYNGLGKKFRRPSYSLQVAVDTCTGRYRNLKSLFHSDPGRSLDACILRLIKLLTCPAMAYIHCDKSIFKRMEKISIVRVHLNDHLFTIVLNGKFTVDLWWLMLRHCRLDPGAKSNLRFSIGIPKLSRETSSRNCIENFRSKAEAWSFRNLAFKFWQGLSDALGENSLIFERTLDDTSDN